MTNETHNASPSSDEAQSSNLAGRLLYLFILLRHTDARMRHGRKHGPAVFEGQGRLLRMLQLRSPIAQKELAYLMGIRPQSLSELISKLERAGLVRKSPNPDDRRTAMIELTDEGREAAASQEPGFDEDQSFGLDAGETQSLIGLLDKVISNVETNTPGGIDRRLERFRRIWIDGDGRGARGFGPGSFGPGGFGGPGFGGAGFGNDGRKPHRGFERGRGQKRGCRNGDVDPQNFRQGW